MKAYSLAIAQAAENTEPDEPVVYSSAAQTDSENTQTKTDNFDAAGDDSDLNSLLSKVAKGKTLSPFGGGYYEFSIKSRPNDLDFI